MSVILKIRNFSIGCKLFFKILEVRIHNMEWIRYLHGKGHWNCVFWQRVSMLPVRVLMQKRIPVPPSTPIEIKTPAWGPVIHLFTVWFLIQESTGQRINYRNKIPLTKEVMLCRLHKRVICNGIGVSQHIINESLNEIGGQIINNI